MSFKPRKSLTFETIPDLSGEWVAVIEPDVVRFEKALDKFSRETRSKSWFNTLMLSSEPSSSWTDREAALFADAVRQAPKALSEEPYVTIRNLISLRDLAAEQDRLGDAFWTPLREACDLLDSDKN